MENTAMEDSDGTVKNVKDLSPGTTKLINTTVILHGLNYG